MVRDEPRTSVPPHLQERLGSFVAEEVISSIRHSVVNDLTALAALCYRLKIEHIIQMPDEQAARAAQDLLDNIQAYVKMASRRLEITFLPATPPTPRSIDAAVVLRGLAERMPVPKGVELEGPGKDSLPLRMDEDELELALACLLTNAYDALSGSHGGRVRLRCAEGPAETVRIDVEHDGAPLGSKARARVFEPFFSTKPGRLGLGLNIARRIAGRWGGTVELTAGASRGVVSTLSLPQSPQRSSEF
jgi:C4-dicarboxylate-specific signal transduction histidine kinase